MSFICHSILPCRCQGPEAGCRGRESGGWCRHPSSGSCLQPLRVMSSVKTMMSHACPCPTPARQQCWQKWGGSSLEVASQGRLELVRAAASAPDAWEEGPDVPGKPPLQKDWQGHRQEMPRGGGCRGGPKGCSPTAVPEAPEVAQALRSRDGWDGCSRMLARVLPMHGPQPMPARVTPQPPSHMQPPPHATPALRALSGSADFKTVSAPHGPPKLAG